MRHFLPPAALAPALLALAPALSAAQTPIIPTVLVKAQDFFTGPAQRVVMPIDVAAGSDTGYATSLLMIAVNSNTNYGVIWGDLVDDGTTAPGILRQTQALSGKSQTRFGDLSMHGGSIAYGAKVSNLPFNDLDSFWIDDDLQYVEGDPAPIPGFEMGYPGSIQLRASGQASVVVRLVEVANPAPYSGALIDYPSGVVRLGPGTPIPGTSLTVAAVLSASVSPDGQHEVASVALSDGRLGILNDGLIYRIDGSDVIVGETIPTRAGGNGQLTWLGLYGVHVDDRNRVTFAGQFAVGSFLEDPTMIVRDGSRVVGSPDVLAGAELRAPRTFPHVGPNGHVTCAWRGSLSSFSGVEVVHDEQWVTRSGTVGVDVNGNGIAQAAWRLVPLAGGFVMRIAVTERGDVLLIHPIERGSDYRPAVLRFRPMPGTPSCVGQPNSTGFPSQLDTFGFDDAALNYLSLRAYDLPRNAPGYFLASRTSGLVPGAGGSSGDLCLAGSIGRYAGNVLSSGPTGTVTLPLDLMSIPQPMGTATATAGETWYFQLWHRDAQGGMATSNFSPAVEVTFD